MTNQHLWGHMNPRINDILNCTHYTRDDARACAKEQGLEYYIRVVKLVVVNNTVDLRPRATDIGFDLVEE